MRVIVQRALESKCIIDNKVYSKIDKGYMLLVGFNKQDNFDILPKMVQKIINLRIFSDNDGKINRSIKDINGSILSISQFTLYANPYNGNRPSFTDALEYEKANELYLEFNRLLREKDIDVKEGIFGSDMKIEFTNDGPVTICLDSLLF